MEIVFTPGHDRTEISILDNPSKILFSKTKSPCLQLRIVPRVKKTGIAFWKIILNPSRFKKNPGLLKREVLFNIFPALTTAFFSLKKEMTSLEECKDLSKRLNLDTSFLSRDLNTGFSGGEKKKNEIFHMLMMKPKLCILDEIDSGLDIDALKVISDGVSKYSNENNSMLIITHYQRLLDYIKPDEVHIFNEGKIIKSGDYNLVKTLEEKGYQEFV